MANRRMVMVGVGALAAMAVVVPVCLAALPAAPVIDGVGEGASVRPEQVRDLGVSADGDIVLLVDGKVVRTRREGDRLLLADPTLRDGEHTLTARITTPMLPDREITRSFRVDSEPPRFTIDRRPVDSPRESYTLGGQVIDATELTVDGEPVRLDEDGRFEVTMPTAPDSVRLVARDAAGNRAEQDYRVPFEHPGMRAVHLSAIAWATPSLRDPVLKMVEDGRIDTIQLDIKDESGEVGYASNVPLAKEIGAARGHYDAREVADQLHEAGVRLVGRLVAFRDPILAKASWNSGQRDRVVQTAGGTPWSGSYGEYAFTNFANQEVIDYNVDLAKEAASLGFDDILYDYVRRPEGAIDQMRLPGLTGTPEQAIVDFLATSREAIREHGAFLGASVFGVAVNRPTSVAQDIPAIASEVDYIAPMVYPSHWGPGEFDVAQPEFQPYDITYRSLKAFNDVVRGTGAKIMPWLQAFSLAKTYGPAEVRAQIDASAKAGSSSYLLWNAACRYENTGLTPKP